MQAYFWASPNSVLYVCTMYIMHSSPSEKGIKMSLQNRQDEAIHPLQVKDDDFPRLIFRSELVVLGMVKPKIPLNHTGIIDLRCVTL